MAELQTLLENRDRLRFALRTAYMTTEERVILAGLLIDLEVKLAKMNALPPSPMWSQVENARIQRNGHLP